MNDLEDRLTDLLTRSADSVAIDVDLSRVTDAPPGRRRRRSRSPYLVGVAAAGVAIAFAVAQLAPGDAEPTRTTGPPPPPPPAEVPRYAAPTENWHLVHHGDNQQTYTTEAGRRMTLTWYPGDQWDERLAHWDMREDEDKRLVGDRYRVVSEANQVALWRNRGYVFEVRGTEHVLDTIDLEEVDEETWR